MTGIGTHAKAKSVPARSGRTVALLGWAITYLDEPSDTGDAFMLYEQRTDSGGMIPPHREDNHEAFYILEGTFEIEIEGQANRYEVGDFLAIQPGILHAIRNVGPGWGRIMTLVSPGSQHQRFFDTLGEPHDAEADPPPLTEPPDFERIATVGEASGIHFVPPPKPAPDRIVTSSSPADLRVRRLDPFSETVLANLRRLLIRAVGGRALRRDAEGDAST